MSSWISVITSVRSLYFNALVSSEVDWGVLELVTMPVVAWLLRPLLLFVVCFCGFHSPRHIIESLRRVKLGWSTIVLTSATVPAGTRP